MAEVKILPQDQVVRIVANADPREFSFFLGAGASFSSGVPLGSDMVREWRAMAYSDQKNAGLTTDDFATWLAAQPWAKREVADAEYSTLFERLFPGPRERQRYIEPKIERAFPGWGYLYLANLIRVGRINLVFTTNFDDLVNDALTRYMGYNAVVCSADSAVASINVSTSRAKILKLHGDYLFTSLKNTGDELARLTENMERKFGEFARQCGMVVIGYAGNDQSIMSLLAALLEDPAAFPCGIYWGVHDPAAPRAHRLEALAAAYPERLHLFRCVDFDIFMASLNAACKLGAPLTVAEPLKAAREGFDKLLAQTTPTLAASPALAEHVALLKAQLGGAIAQADAPDTLDLFEAQIALAGRRYADALPFVERYVASHPRDASALTIWGSALMTQAEEEGRRELVDAAVAKWREAVACDPSWTPARYNLVRHHTLRQEFREAIAQAEALVTLAPRDATLRLTLAQLYAGASRIREAIEGVEQLLRDDPDNVTLLVHYSVFLDQRGRPVEAQEAIARAVQLAPANPLVRMQAAQAYARAARPVDASSEFVQAIQLDPKNVAYRIMAAQFFLSVNQAPQALLHLREAARLEPESAEVKGWLAMACMGTGAMQEAQREIEAALALEQSDSRLLGTAAQVYMATRQPERAEACLQQAITVNPSAVGPYVSLVQLYAGWQRWPQAQAVLQQVAMIDPAIARQLQQQIFGGAASAGAFGGPQPGQGGRGLLDWLGIPRQ